MSLPDVCAADQNAFAEELSTCLAQLVNKYDDTEVQGGRSFHFLLAGYPALSRPTIAQDHQAQGHEAEE